MSERFLDKRWPWLLAAGAIIAAFLSQFEVEFSTDPDRRKTEPAEAIAALAERDDVNVLFIVIDTLRAERLGAYGHVRDTSPALDALAESGVLFSRHLAQSSWTKCSMASLWTGLNPVRNGVTRFDHVLPDVATLPAEILREEGFHTVGIYRNGWVSENFGFAQGFDVYTRPSTKPLPPTVRLENPTLGKVGTDADILDAAREYLRVEGDERWLLYLHLMDVHEYVYDIESAQFGSGIADLYDNSVLHTDRQLQGFFDYLIDQGFYDNTLIVITSDHGEAFLERGHEGHARRVYRESTEIPLLFSFPFKLDPGLVVQTRSANVDVWPTILDLVGAAPLEESDGRSLVPAMLAQARGEALSDEPATSFLDLHWGQRGRKPNPSVAVADGSWRYIQTPDATQPLEEIFDASNDPAERRNLASDDPERLAHMRALSDQYMGAPPLWGDAPTREIGELELNQLRALGYAVP
jgi:arylsulfatase A-like enzyme